MAFGPDTDAMLGALMDSDFSDDQESWAEAVEADRSQRIDMPEPDEEGNFFSSALEALHLTWEVYEEEDCEEPEVLKVIAEVRKAVDSQLRFLEQTAKSGEADAANPVHQWVQKGLTLQLQGLDTMARYFESGQEELVDQGLALFQQGTNQMMQGFAEFQRMRLEVLQFECPSCGAKNFRGENICSSCSATLPRALAEVSAQDVAAGNTPEMLSTANFNRVSAGVDSWRNGEMESATLAAMATELVGVMQAHGQDLKRGQHRLWELDSKERGQMTEWLEKTEEALAGSIQALQAFAQAATKAEAPAVETALDGYWEATQVMIAAYKGLADIVRQADTGG